MGPVSTLGSQDGFTRSGTGAHDTWEALSPDVVSTLPEVTAIDKGGECRQVSFGQSKLKTNMITTPSQFGRALNQPYAWPGGYPTYFITSDGAALCCDCAKRQGRQICDSIRTRSNDGWRVESQDINWEDASLYCDHCGERIESAYAEDEAQAIRAGTRQV